MIDRRLPAPALTARRDPSLWLEALANIALAILVTWTVIWFGSPAIGVEAGSWFVIFHPGVLAMFAIVGVPVGLFWTWFGLPIRGARMLEMRPLKASRHLADLVRETRAAMRG